jgi:hypothetical protein
MAIEKGEKYTVRIVNRRNRPLLNPIVFIGECFNIEKNYVEFIDVNTQNVRVVDIHCDQCIKKGGRRSRRVKSK